MSRKCDICGKKPMLGRNVSHAHNRTSKKYYPNLHEIRVDIGGKPARLKVCTRCIKAGKIKKFSR